VTVHFSGDEIVGQREAVEIAVLLAHLGLQSLLRSPRTLSARQCRNQSANGNPRWPAPREPRPHHRAEDFLACVPQHGGSAGSPVPPIAVNRSGQRVLLTHPTTQPGAGPGAGSESGWSGTGGRVRTRVTDRRGCGSPVTETVTRPRPRKRTRSRSRLVGGWIGDRSHSRGRRPFRLTAMPRTPQTRSSGGAATESHAPGAA
jgi:hypothetical protein